ncbi:MAG: glutamate-5-semialdehyde dehydrogenase [Synergistaceae bacterium]|nr:glutamate-5-semialdehyde dehydrogenase [Synergistaceae bacterium]
MDMQIKVQRAHEAAQIVAQLGIVERNKVLKTIASQLLKSQDSILKANSLDVEKARTQGASPAFIDRLSLTSERLKGLSDSILQVVSLPDPLAKDIGWTRPNGLHIRQVKVPLGTIAIIYEARPNVTVDSAVLCLKSANACILRGSSHALNSNRELVKVMRHALEICNIPVDGITFIEDTSHESVTTLTSFTQYIDVVIPRGGQNLINSVKANSKVPVIETGVGKCHLYIHSEADLNMGLNILINGKTQRPGVCNALETLLVDKKIAKEFLHMVNTDPTMQKVLFHACPSSLPCLSKAVPAQEEDWDKEYLALEMAVKVVDNLEEAINHINRHSTGHSEAIITNNYTAAQTFQKLVTSCAVYVNASTRFTDGGEFGFGAEIGISTQKLHARGPLGLEHLTSVKYLIDGAGQVR